MAADRVKTLLRLTPELHDRLTKAAESYGLPVNYLAGRLLTEALDDLIPPDQFRLTGPPTTDHNGASSDTPENASQGQL